jgi:mono/diheme cytochrome c family protein
VGHLFNSITNGIRTMPSYGSQIPVEDRWAIVAYVRALQRAAHAPASVLSAEEQGKLVEVVP